MCDFIVLTKNSSITRWIWRNGHFLEETLSKGEVFFMDHLILELVCCHQNPQLTEELNCPHCKRSSFDKMITYKGCCQQFHYKCEQCQTDQKLEMWM